MEKTTEGSNNEPRLRDAFRIIAKLVYKITGQEQERIFYLEFPQNTMDLETFHGRSNKVVVGCKLKTLNANGIML